MGLFSEEQIKKHEARISEISKRHEELVKQDREGRDRMRTLNKELQEAEQLIQNHRRELEQMSRAFNIAAREDQRLMREKQDLQKQLADDKFEKDLQAEIKKQPSFWDNLRPTLEKTNQELTTGLNGIENKIDYDETVKQIKHQLTQGRGFNHNLLSASEHINSYNGSMRVICEKRLRKEKLSLQELQKINSRVVAFLMHPAIESMWNKL